MTLANYSTAELPTDQARRYVAEQLTEILEKERDRHLRMIDALRDHHARFGLDETRDALRLTRDRLAAINEQLDSLR